MFIWNHHSNPVKTKYAPYFTTWDFRQDFTKSRSQLLSSCQTGCAGRCPLSLGQSSYGLAESPEQWDWRSEGPQLTVHNVGQEADAHPGALGRESHHRNNGEVKDTNSEAGDLDSNCSSMGLPWWHSGWESACQCRGHGFEPWSGKIPHAAERLGPRATTTEPARLEPVLLTKRGRDSERPAHRDEEWPPLAATGESPRTETKTQHSHK